MSRERHSAWLKAKALELGFGHCGISKARFLEEEAPRLEDWLRQGRHGQMSYMANHFDLRLDPTKLVPGAQSVVSLLYHYFPEQDLAREGNYKLAKYAYGEDYHFVIKRKLQELLQALRDEVGEVEGRAFVDSAPVMERSWAQQGGLGWMGKHTLLIGKGQGSFFFLAELIIDLPLAPDGPVPDYCGTCTRCIDACPTEAITAPYQLDASRCISYLTIELKEAIPDEFAGRMEDWVFGCDICQDVCPWNRFAKPHQEPAFLPTPELPALRRRDWEEMTEEVFRKAFRKSAVKRAKYEGLMRNVRFAGRKNEP
jgi:epoxyqueuosine reductase